MTPEKAVECARTAILNAVAVIADAAGGIDAIERIVKVTVFVASAPDFTGHPQVANGASELLAEIFGEPGSTPAVRSGWPCCRWTRPWRSR